MGGGEATPAAALGMLSLIVWTLIITASTKYVAIVMRPDNDGEGGRAFSSTDGDVVLRGQSYNCAREKVAPGSGPHRSPPLSASCSGLVSGRVRRG